MLVSFKKKMTKVITAGRLLETLSSKSQFWFKFSLITKQSTFQTASFKPNNESLLNCCQQLIYKRESNFTFSWASAPLHYSHEASEQRVNLPLWAGFSSKEKSEAEEQDSDPLKLTWEQMLAWSSFWKVRRWCTEPLQQWWEGEAQTNDCSRAEKGEREREGDTLPGRPYDVLPIHSAFLSTKVWCKPVSSQFNIRVEKMSVPASSYNFC